jgi:hypothetical protein
MTQRELEALSEDDCYKLAGEAPVGRLLYVDGDGPAAVPVNFAMAGHDIVFRSETGTKKHALSQAVAGFAVDNFAPEQHSGWSVLFRGPVREVDIDDVPALIKGMEGRFPMPWAVGVHNQWLRLSPTHVTGRQLGKASSVPVV